MGKHPRKVEGYEGSLKQLAHAVGNMEYDKTASFIEKLAADIKTQANSDSLKGRKQLAAKIYSAAEKLYKAREDMNSAWAICKPYQKKSEEK